MKEEGRKEQGHIMERLPFHQYFIAKKKGKRKQRSIKNQGTSRSAHFHMHTEKILKSNNTIFRNNTYDDHGLTAQNMERQLHMSPSPDGYKAQRTGG